MRGQSQRHWKLLDGWTRPNDPTAKGNRSFQQSCRDWRRCRVSALTGGDRIREMAMRHAATNRAPSLGLRAYPGLITRVAFSRPTPTITAENQLYRSEPGLYLS